MQPLDILRMGIFSSKQKHRKEIHVSAQNAGNLEVEHESAKNAGHLRVEHEKSAKNAGDLRVEHNKSDEAKQSLEILHIGEQQTEISDSNDDQVTVDKKVLVAAIDIGTSYSGYAFSFAHEQKEGEEDPDRIYVNNWENDGGSRTYFKTPSCLLLHPNGNLDCFGYEALDRYKTLIEDGKHKDVYFFMDFKMILHQEEVCDTGDCR